MGETAILYLARLFYRHGISAKYREMAIVCAELFHCRGNSDDKTMIGRLGEENIQRSFSGEFLC